MHLKHVMLEEQLSIFLYICVTGLLCSHVGEHFQQSNDTISKYVYFFSCFASRELTTACRYFCRMLVAFSSPKIYTKYIQLPCADDSTPSDIIDDPIISPYFKDTIGTVDRTHITCTPSATEREVTCNRKGFHSQNCLVCCIFNLKFVYVLSGWEGFAADASVYHDAHTTNFTIPTGKFVLNFWCPIMVYSIIYLNGNTHKQGTYVLTFTTRYSMVYFFF